MTAVLLDTHTWAWSLGGDVCLSSRTLTAVSEADTMLVSPIKMLKTSRYATAADVLAAIDVTPARCRLLAFYLSALFT